MNLNIYDITFIIVTYKSELHINKCLNTLPKESKKIIIENSGNINLKEKLKSKYDNIEVIISNNVGMGAGNNIGLKACKTSFAYVLNPDTKFHKDTFDNLVKEVSEISDFTLLSPLNDDPNFPNYKAIISNNNNILSVKRIDGFSILINLKKFEDKYFFDENFFLYLENDDLCIRVKNKNENIYILKNSLINHVGGISKNENLEYLRNWHWMWSKFYFNKKHYGFMIAFMKVFSNVASSILKYFFYSIFYNLHKKKIYQMRLSGLINSILGKKSFFRLDN